jgi:hypothetical protein
MAVPTKTDPTQFASRLKSVRSAHSEHSIAADTAYKNGQISGDDTGSNWDNFDRYFKFYNISPD